MRVSKDQLARNRARILEAAARLFRERGFENVTVAQVMAAAGLTHGAFYGHFASKDDLIARALETALDDMTTDGRDSLAAYAGRYLTVEHRDDPADGCIYAALGSEAVRASDDARHVLTAALQRHLGELEAKAPGNSPTERRRAAIAGWSSMMGALLLSRMVDDPVLSAELITETRAALEG